MLGPPLLSLSKLKWVSPCRVGAHGHQDWTAVRRTRNTNAAQWIIHDPVGLPLEENCTARASVYCSSAPLKLPVWCYGKWQHVGVTVTSTQQGHHELQISSVFWVFGKIWQLLLFCLCGLSLHTHIMVVLHAEKGKRCLVGVPMKLSLHLFPFITLYLEIYKFP